MEKRPFFRAAHTAGLGKYHTGGYGRIGVYRVKDDRGQGCIQPHPFLSASRRCAREFIDCFISTIFITLNKVYIYIQTLNTIGVNINKRR